MLGHEWENPSSIMLPGEEEDSQLDRRIFDPYAAGNYSGTSAFVNFHDTHFALAAGHHLHVPFHHTQTQNMNNMYESRAYEASAPSSYYGPEASTLSLHPFGPDPGFMVEPKREPVVGGLEFRPGASRIGLNLGGRTYFASSEDDLVSKLYRRSRFLESGGSVNYPRCQAEGCNADLTHSKHYHRRHKVCEFHSKAATVISAGLTKRFCQQCSRFHLLSEFDNDKRSCRKRLADHNRRRRKSNQTNPENKSGHLRVELDGFKMDSAKNSTGSPYSCSYVTAEVSPP